MSAKKNDKNEIQTTGHNWDGIEELDTPMPRWWLWTFYITIVWAIGYWVAYPAWPLLSGSTPGVLEYSSRGEVAADIASVNAANAAFDTKLVETPLADIKSDEELNTYAFNGGRAVFAINCLQCHGAGAQGFKGYPNLLDDDWLWGGDIDAIYQTVSHGIRVETEDDTRYSEMPKFGEFLEEAEIGNLVQYVLSISGADHDAAAAAAGTELYVDNCESCHAEDGTGDREQGAPNLTDAIWLYGGDVETLTDSVTNARFGVMPNWSGRLSEAQIRQVTAYVHQLGGGE